MSNRKLRSERNCLNCGRYVEVRYCSNCGQENTINRPSFYYLFTSFFKDLVNYDSNFWRTISILLFKPGVIVNQYLAGKRSSFVSPIKLYFFISLFTFLLPYDLISYSEEAEIIPNIKSSIELSNSPTKDKESDSIPNLTFNEKQIESVDKQTQKDDFLNLEGLDVHPLYATAKTRKQFDSIHKSLPDKDRVGWFFKPIYRKIVEFNEKGITFDGSFQDIFINSFKRNFPRVLIFYLPVFAFVLWVFHGKKKWKYYDHGIFTIYFFSFLLLLASIMVLLNWFLAIMQNLFPIASSIDNIGSIVFLISFLYVFFYFFRSHRRIYKESKTVSRIKSFFIFGINFFLFVFSLVMYTIVTFLML